MPRPESSYGSRKPQPQPPPRRSRNQLSASDFLPQDGDDDDDDSIMEQADNEHKPSSAMKSKLLASKKNAPNVKMKKAGKKAAKNPINFLAQAPTHRERKSTRTRRSSDPGMAASSTGSNSDVPSSLGSKSSRALKSSGTPSSLGSSTTASRVTNHHSLPVPRKRKSPTASTEQQNMCDDSDSETVDERSHNGGARTSHNNGYFEEEVVAIDSSQDTSELKRPPTQELLAGIERYDPKEEQKMAAAIDVDAADTVEVLEIAESPPPSSNLRFTKVNGANFTKVNGAKKDQKHTSVLERYTIPPKDPPRRQHPRRHKRKAVPIPLKRIPGASLLPEWTVDLEEAKPPPPRKRDLKVKTNELELEPSAREQKRHFGGASKRRAKPLPPTPTEDPSIARLQKKSSAERKKKKVNEVIEIDDDDDDEEDASIGDENNAPLHRIAVGNDVYRTDCSIKVQKSGISFRFKDSSGASHTESLAYESMRMFLFHQNTKEGNGSDYIFIQRGKTSSKRRARRSEGNDPPETVVFEFKAHFKSVLKRWKENSIESYPDGGQHVDCENELQEYCAPFFEADLVDSPPRNRRRGRMAATPRAPMFREKKDTDILLDYPFATPREIGRAAEGLGVLACVLDELDSKEAQQEQEGGVHILIRISDYDRLVPGIYLNDNLIDLFCQWIWSTVDQSKVHFFTSHFFSTLEKKGPAGVASWTKKRNINIFGKKFIFIPAKEAAAWASDYKRAAASDEDASENLNDILDNPVPCILFFDSLRAHGKGHVSKKVRSWLNSEWARFSPADADKDIFNDNTLPIISPHVPEQDNGYDCGVFVCRYAHAMYCLRGQPFTFSSAGMIPGSKENHRTWFNALITASEAFNFDMDAIRDTRAHLRTLVENLHVIYLPWRQEHQAKLKEERQKEKEERKGSAGDKPVTESSSSHDCCDLAEIAEQAFRETEEEDVVSSQSYIDVLDALPSQSSIVSEQAAETNVQKENQHHPNELVDSSDEEESSGDPACLTETI